MDRRASNDALAAFRRSLGETAARCLARPPSADPQAVFRTPELRPPDWRDAGDGLRGFLAVQERVERTALVHAVVAARARMLGTMTQAPASTPDHLAGGRLLLYNPDLSLSDGGAEAYSDGFFDAEDTPPWDCWAWMASEEVCGHTIDLPDRNEWCCYLLAWIPPQLVTLAERGIEASIGGSLAWAADVEAPFLRRLRTQGLM
jgi:hypothetical protein